MASVCPFAKALRPDDSSVKKHSENQSKFQTDSEDKGKTCPFAKLHKPDDSSTNNPSEEQNTPQVDGKDKAEGESGNSAVIPAKCPYGFDSQAFKIGPFSCVICQALLFKSSRCVPCSHIFCYACVSRFKDCPLCGADIERIEDDVNLQAVVDRFIDGHARIKRSHAETDPVGVENEKKTIVYEDVSLERGAFLVQHAMRAFRAQNIESAKSRLSLCSEDIREQLNVLGSTSELCSQLGAVLGMLGDCCRALGESESAVLHYEESVEFLQKLPCEDQEIVHTLSVSLNKIGDLKYYSGDLQSARSYYLRSLNVRRKAAKLHPNVSSQVLDVAVSLAKVADVDRSLGNEDAAIEGFEEGIKLLESLTLNSDDLSQEQRCTSVMDFLKSQLAEKQPAIK
uniref:RING-type domain-containing protein n=1 Tax=Kalanchoe fedtschenkoi TaxID=63787 RepID=A0A7N0RFK4_KALFE